MQEKQKAVGSAPVEEYLSRLAGGGRMPHALILEGPENSGKNELARLIAQWAVCTAGTDRPCGSCAGCRKALAGGHPDITTAQGGTGARSFHVDAVRQIRADAYILPNEAAHKVYLLLDADNMTDQAQNALLKVLEEPPEYVIFVLTCASASALLSTVRSRAQTVTLEAVGQAEQTLGMELAKQLAEAILSTREYGLLGPSGKLIKDKELLRAVLKQLQIILRDACVYAGGGTAMLSDSETAERLARRITLERLMAMMQVVKDAARMTEQNANQNLLVTWLCASLRAC